MITITGETMKEIYCKVRLNELTDTESIKYVGSVKKVSNRYIINLPKDAEGRNILIKFEDNKHDR